MIIKRFLGNAIIDCYCVIEGMKIGFYLTWRRDSDKTLNELKKIKKWFIKWAGYSDYDADELCIGIIDGCANLNQCSAYKWELNLIKQCYIIDEERDST